MSSAPAPPATAAPKASLGFVQSDTANTANDNYLPSMSNEQIWDWFGNCAVFSHSPQHMVTAFDVLFHSKGLLFYRMKSKKDRDATPLPDPKDLKVKHGWFEGERFHDSMGYVLSRKEGEGKVCVVFTHDRGTKELHDVIECSDTITFKKFDELRQDEKKLIAFRDAGKEEGEGDSDSEMSSIAEGGDL